MTQRHYNPLAEDCHAYGTANDPPFANHAACEASEFSRASLQMLGCVVPWTDTDRACQRVQVNASVLDRFQAFVNQVERKISVVLKSGYLLISSINSKKPKL